MVKQAGFYAPMTAARCRPLRLDDLFPPQAIHDLHIKRVGLASFPGRSYMLEYIMRTWSIVVLAQLLVCTLVVEVAAQDRPSGQPGVVTGGSGNTSIGGMPAAR